MQMLKSAPSLRLFDYLLSRLKGSLIWKIVLAILSLPSTRVKIQNSPY